MTDVSNQGTQGAPPAPSAPAPAPATPAVAPAATPAVPAADPVQGQAAPAAPAAPAVPETPPVAPTIGDPATPAADTPDGTADKDGVVQYAPTGDAGMDMALTFVGKLGLLPTHPAMIKASEGDFSFIKAHMSTLGDKALGWEQHIALAEQSFSNNVKKQEELTKQVTASVYKAAGGQEAWNAIEAWAKQNADPKEKEEINRMLGASPVSAQAATILLKGLYERATGTTVKPGKVLSGQPGAEGGIAAAGPLSPKDYAKAVFELNRAKPGAVDRGDPEYKQLQQRALAYRR